MSYSYYEITRAVATFTFIVLGTFVIKNGHTQFVQIVYYSLAFLFQPLFKIHLGRTIWNFVDIVVGIGLLVSVIMVYRQRKKLI
jgi:hypothetical protein